VDLNGVNNSVGQSQESILDGNNKIMGGSVAALELNRSGGEGLVQLGLEGKGKSLATEGIDIGVVVEPDVLDLVLLCLVEVITLVHHIIAPGAEALRAVNITELGVADAGTSLLVVPLVEGGGFDVLDELAAESIGAVEGAVGKAKGLDVLAGSVAGAIIGAGSSLASLAFVSLEALAFTGTTVADTLVGALGVLVEFTIPVRGVHPSELEGADTVRAITSVKIIAHTPVIVAEAESAFADAVSAAAVVAGGGGIGREGEGNSSSHHLGKVQKYSSLIQLVKLSLDLL
jgi:hypothetical protein